jgi:CRP-like cAMP-binding protein
MFLLVEGDAVVTKSTPEGESYRVAILRAEQFAFFGEGGLLDSEARSATIRAETPCRCLVLHREMFEKFGREHPQWAMPILLRIARVVMTRLRKTNHDMGLLYNALVAEIRGH